MIEPPTPPVEPAKKAEFEQARACNRVPNEPPPLVCCPSPANEPRGRSSAAGRAPANPKFFVGHSGKIFQVEPNAFDPAQPRGSRFFGPESQQLAPEPLSMTNCSHPQRTFWNVFRPQTSCGDKTFLARLWGERRRIWRQFFGTGKTLLATDLWKREDLFYTDKPNAKKRPQQAEKFWD